MPMVNPFQGGIPPEIRKLFCFFIALVAISIGSVVIAPLGHAMGMSQPAAIALTILIAGAALWITEAVPLFVTSLLILLLCIVWLLPEIQTAEAPLTSSVFLSPFFSDIILLFLGGFVLSTALHKFRLDEQMARLIIRRCGSSIDRLLLGIMGTTAFLSMWLSNTATAAMMLALVLPILRSVPEGSNLRKIMILSIPLSANAGGLGTPIGSPPNAIAMQYLDQIGLAPSFPLWMAIGVPGAAGLVLVAWFLLRLFYRSTDQLKDLEFEPLDIGCSPSVVLVITGTLVTILGWLTGNWHGLSTGTVALFPLILFFGAGVLNVRDLRSMSWDVLLVMGGGLCLGTAISLSGLATWIVESLPSDSLGAYAMLCVFCVLACGMSTIMSNTATANLLMPILLGLHIEPRSPIFLGVAFSCSLAMALPISTPPNAMAFSSGEIRSGDLLKPGLLMSVIGVASILTIGYWWWDLVGCF